MKTRLVTVALVLLWACNEEEPEALSDAATETLDSAVTIAPTTMVLGDAARAAEGDDSAPVSESDAASQTASDVHVADSGSTVPEPAPTSLDTGLVIDAGAGGNVDAQLIADADAGDASDADAFDTDAFDADASDGDASDADASDADADAGELVSEDADTGVAEDARVFNDAAADAGPSTYAELDDAIRTRLYACAAVGEGEYHRRPIVDELGRCTTGCLLAAECPELQDYMCGDSAAEISTCIAHCSNLTKTPSFTCGTTTLWQSWVCDGLRHCKNSEDEANCQTYTCQDGQVITYANARCDGKANCKDKSDEADCASTCPSALEEE